MQYTHRTVRDRESLTKQQWTLLPMQYTQNSPRQTESLTRQQWKLLPMHYTHKTVQDRWKVWLNCTDRKTQEREKVWPDSSENFYLYITHTEQSKTERKFDQTAVKTFTHALHTQWKRLPMHYTHRTAQDKDFAWAAVKTLTKALHRENGTRQKAPDWTAYNAVSNECEEVLTLYLMDARGGAEGGGGGGRGGVERWFRENPMWRQEKKCR